MANVNANVHLDNYSQSGDQTLQQMQSEIAAATGSHPGIAEQVRDPATGKLIKVVLTMPQSAAAVASARIAANRGVATVAVGSPALFLDDLTGILASGVIYAGGTSEGIIKVITESSVTLGTSTSAGYVDGAELMSAERVLLDIPGYPNQ